MDPFTLLDDEAVLALVASAAQTGRIAPGAAQAVRAVEQGKAQVVIVAQNTEPDLTGVVSAVANKAGIPVVTSSTRAALGAAAEIETGAAAVAIVRFGVGGTDFDPATIVSTARCAEVVPYISRVDHVLRFREKFAPPLLDGRKTATLRLGLRVPRALELPLATQADQVFATAMIRELGWLTFADVENRPDILEAEWPSDYGELAVEMSEAYGQAISPTSHVTYYRFTVLADTWPEALDAAN